MNPTPGAKLVTRDLIQTRQGDPPLREARIFSNSANGDTPNSTSSGNEAHSGSVPLPFNNGTLTEIPAQQAFEATGFMDPNESGNLDFLGQVGGVYDAINFPEGLLDFGAWANFFSGDPNASRMSGNVNV